jgi:hypothetical protein
MIKPFRGLAAELAHLPKNMPRPKRPSAENDGRRAKALALKSAQELHDFS